MTDNLATALGFVSRVRIDSTTGNGYQAAPMEQLIRGFDRALRTLTGQHRAKRPSPAQQTDSGEGIQEELSLEDARHSAGLMRVNHTGEVCAQALYDGQAATARNPEVTQALSAAGDEEVDHLMWCEDRLRDLDARPSVLNPLFYGASWALGAVTGLLGDRTSLAFVEATEDQVVKHLDRHLESLPENDVKSRAVVTQMRADEARHGDEAFAMGGSRLSAVQKRVMAAVAKVMTATTYRI